MSHGVRLSHVSGSVSVTVSVTLTLTQSVTVSTECDCECEWCETEKSTQLRLCFMETKLTDLSRATSWVLDPVFGKPLCSNWSLRSLTLRSFKSFPPTRKLLVSSAMIDSGFERPGRSRQSPRPSPPVVPERLSLPVQ